LRRIALGLVVALVLLIGVMTVRATAWKSRQLAAAPAPLLAVDSRAAAERLAGAIRIPTVSEDAARMDAAFREIQEYLARSFPRTDAALRKEAIGARGLLYAWPGADPTLSPVVLMGHLDVVPVQKDSEKSWSHPPFGGETAGGFVWGRGSLDDKAGVLGILEAAETLLAQGFAPRRTVLFAFGADEETGGRAGAAEIATVLRRRGISPWLVVDEGGLIAEGIVPGVRAPVALVGIAEKGYATVELAAESAGGHSSMPPRHTAVGVLARAVSRLEAAPFPATLRGVGGEFFDFVGPEMAFPMRFAFANRWLLAPLLEGRLAASPETDALIRTTTAATMFEGGPKDNVLPSRARAAVNFRILPGDSVAGVLEHVRRVVRDPAVRVRVLGQAVEPSPVSSTDSPSWIALQRTIRQIFPDAVVAPYLVLGGTDARYLAPLSANVYRFLPVRLTSRDLARVHGIDERLATADYASAIRFYERLLRNAAQ